MNQDCASLWDTASGSRGPRPAPSRLRRLGHVGMQSAPAAAGSRGISVKRTAGPAFRAAAAERSRNPTWVCMQLRKSVSAGVRQAATRLRCADTTRICSRPLGHNPLRAVDPSGSIVNVTADAGRQAGFSPHRGSWLRFAPVALCGTAALLSRRDNSADVGSAFLFCVAGKDGIMKCGPVLSATT